MTNFGTLLSYEQPTKYIVNDTNYKPTYKTPVLTAGKSFILGYTNETDNIFDDLPVIIFDDFTTESKFVDFPFKVKSSAMKILHINQDLVLPKYAFYLMQATEIDHDNHQRYWISTYSQEIISLPPLSEQIKIIETVENLFDLTQSVETNSQNLKNSIKTTKSKILDLAIRGKLVPQDPNDEPASVLLERIRAEKEELIKQGKIKRDKKESVIFKGDDNSYYLRSSDNKSYDVAIPFDLPTNWEWCLLGDIFNISSSKRVLKNEWKSSGVPFFRAREIVKLSINGTVDNDLFISPEHYENLKKKYGVPNAGDLMVTGVGTIGKAYIVKENDVFYYKDASVLCFENIYKAINPKFAKLMIDSNLIQNQIHSKTYGNTVDTITISTAKNYLCVLPPLAEQNRIVDNIETIFSKLDSIADSIA